MDEIEISVIIKFVDNKKFKDELKKTGLTDQYSNFRLRLTRGFTTKNLIYIRKNTRIGLANLILHELGHVMGKKHTKWPTIMNPFGFLRLLPKI